jgi:hypothetical protein
MDIPTLTPLEAEQLAHQDAAGAIRSLQQTQRRLESYNAGILGDPVHLQRLQHDLDFFQRLLDVQRAKLASAMPATAMATP